MKVSNLSEVESECRDFDVVAIDEGQFFPEVLRWRSETF
jgi:thymidine kinase